MRKLWIPIVATAISGSFAAIAHGAAATGTDGLTSCKKLSSDPVKRQIQIATDPFSIVNFQLTQQFDADLLSVVDLDPGEGTEYDVQGINGYLITDVSVQILTFNLGDGPFHVGFVTVAGHAGPSTPVDQELDMFQVNYELGSNFSLTTPLTFQTVALPSEGEGGDFMQDTTGKYYWSDHIISSSSGTVFIAVPGPSPMCALAAPVAFFMRRRRSA